MLVNARLLHSLVIAIEFVLHWMSHLQCCVLITHSAVVKVRNDCNVHVNTNHHSSIMKVPQLSLPTSLWWIIAVKEKHQEWTPIGLDNKHTVTLRGSRVLGSTQ